MEYEVRYYYSSEELERILTMVRRCTGIKEQPRCYEKTTQYDHPCAGMSFYTKEIDGRFRVRVMRSDEGDRCMVSWKRRLPDTAASADNREEEVELTIQPEEYENLRFIVEEALKMRAMESYERYRTRFVNAEVEIAVDEYPFGVALEIENKSPDRPPAETVEKWVRRLGLELRDAYRLSWDDKYAELCEEQGVERYTHVEFGRPMPEVK